MGPQMSGGFFGWPYWMDLGPECTAVADCLRLAAAISFAVTEVAIDFLKLEEENPCDLSIVNFLR